MPVFDSPWMILIGLSTPAALRVLLFVIAAYAQHRLKIPNKDVVNLLNATSLGGRWRRQGGQGTDVEQVDSQVPSRSPST